MALDAAANQFIRLPYATTVPISEDNPRTVCLWARIDAWADNARLFEYGKGPAQRFGLVSRFNADPSIDVLLLTTAVGGLAGAAQVGLAAAASKPPSQKPPRPKKKAVGGLAGAAVGGLAGAAQRPVGGLAGAAASYDYDIASP